MNMKLLLAWLVGFLAVAVAVGLGGLAAILTAQESDWRWAAYIGLVLWIVGVIVWRTYVDLHMTPEEHLTREEATNLAAYSASVNAEVERMRALPPDVPVNDEYCWMHTDQPDGGGWCCAVCRSEETKP